MKLVTVLHKVTIGNDQGMIDRVVNINIRERKITS